MRILFLALLSLSLVSLFSCKNQNQQEAVTNEKKEITFDSLKVEYLESGKQIAMESGKTLKSKLMESITKGGIESGITVCNSVAQTMMDSLSKIHSVEIRRTSLKARNTIDKPIGDELEMLNFYETEHNKGNKLEPQVKELADGKVNFYMPIMIEETCIKCHGTIGKDVPKELYDKIKEKYPNDEAFNYKVGDFRGMWSIKMNKK
jgi:hypothetical protein